MTTERATRLLNASPARTLHVLLDARAVPEWNPAFQSLEGPAAGATGVPYAITVRGLKGTWEYTHIDDGRIDTLWQVPGFLETGTWRLRPDGGGTMVTHAFQHRGPLAFLLRNAYRGVAELRLDRLAERAGDR